MEIVRLETPEPDGLYDRDFYSWARRQADLLRAGRFADIDAANLAEEIDTLGRSEAASLESAYRLIAMHQLKRLAQPEFATRSWSATIQRERLHAARVLRDNPGLKPRRQALFEAAYADARKEAAVETGLPSSAFPGTAPFSLAELMDDDFWAGSAPR